ncbi:MAG TPA: hypothetical protein VF937_16555 [Chloroflexota bacterium]
MARSLITGGAGFIGSHLANTERILRACAAHSIRSIGSSPKTPLDVTLREVIEDHRVLLVGLAQSRDVACRLPS